MLNKFQSGLKLYLLLSILLAHTPAFAHTKPVRIITSEYFPFNYLDPETSQVTGFAYDLVSELVNVVEPELTIELFSWKSAYLLLNQSKPVMYFTLVRTPARENKFQWVGPISSERYYFYRSLANEEAGSKVATIGAVRGFATAEYLSRKAQRKVKLYPTEKMLFQSFAKGAHPLLFHSDVSVCGKLELFGLHNMRLVAIEKSHPVQNYFAFNQATPKRLVERFQQALDVLKANGRIAELEQQYFHDKYNCINRPVLAD